MWLLVFIYWDRVYLPRMRSNALEEHSPQSSASQMSVGALPEKRMPPEVTVFNNWVGVTGREWPSCPPVGSGSGLPANAFCWLGRGPPRWIGVPERQCNDNQHGSFSLV